MACKPTDSFFLSAICTFILALGSNAFSQTSPEFESGPLQDVVGAMRQLVQLEIADRRLAIQKDWERTNPVADRQDLIDDEIKKLKARGFDEATASNLAVRIVRTTAEELPFSKAFFAVTSNLPFSKQKRSAAGKRIVGFQNSRILGKGEIKIRESDVQLQFVERKGPRREFRISHASNGAFEFRYLGKQFSIALLQKRNAEVNLSRTLQGKTESFSASDFVALHREHPKLVNKWLFPLMAHLGISTPIMTDDGAMINAALKKLVSYSQRMVEFERLVEQLNSRDYEIRNSAHQKIIANGGDWLVQIEKKLESKSLPMETRVRLLAAMGELDSGSPIDKAIREQKLLDSPDFLINILDQADTSQAAAVIRRLREVTNHSFEQPIQWRQWLMEQNQKKRDQKDSVDQ